MKALLILAVALLPSLAWSAPSRPKNLPDLPPDATSSQYLSAQPALRVQANDGLDQIVGFGERNLKWLEHINSLRPEGQKLSFTSKETQRGIPIDRPNEYNVPLTQQKFSDLKPKIPAAMQKVLFENADFTDQPPVALDDYLTNGRELDRVFQTALRWRMMKLWLGYLAGRRHQDLRGWYFLSKMSDRAEKLRGFAKLPASERAQLRSWLISLCFNMADDENLEPCGQTIDEMISKGEDLEAYYQAKAGESEFMYQTFFRIPNGVGRPEVRFDSPALTVAPFQDPGKPEVRAFLRDNIQDEWRFGDWHLELPFENNEDLPEVVFRPGAVPNVNGLGGNIITMNASQPLTEYDAQWTIRHEYGHVLGLPDCYVEFYEAERDVIVNYQFDIDNLMCSRHGHIQAQHVEELKRTYQK